MPRAPLSKDEPPDVRTFLVPRSDYVIDDRRCCARLLNVDVSLITTFPPHVVSCVDLNATAGPKPAPTLYLPVSKGRLRFLIDP